LYPTESGLETAPVRRGRGRGCRALREHRSAAPGETVGQDELEDRVGRQSMVLATYGWTRSMA
jgi:hypothetical protein